MLYIEEDDNKSSIRLPEKYHEVHNLSVSFYDDIADTLKLEVRAISVPKNDSTPDFTEKMPIDEIIQWLNTNGYEKEIDFFLTYHIIASLVADFCNFVYEALSCTKNGKLTVAISLIRKPFLENLLLLEDIYTNGENFYQKFNKNTSEYDPGKVSEDEKKTFIASILTKIYPVFANMKDFIYQIRFDKKDNSSLYSFTNKAIHLVTTRHNNKTSEGNLNFVFSTVENIESQWSYFYTVIPLLLFYSAELIEQIISNYTLIPNEGFFIRRARRMIGLVAYTNIEPDSSNKTLKSLAKSVKIECPQCKSSITAEKEDLILFYHSGTFFCSKCLSFANSNLKEVLKFLE